MPLFLGNNKNIRSLSFNITPVIDIIFLLIIFFVVDFQFLGNDSQQLQLPDKCDFARSYGQALPDAAIIVVTKDEFGRIQYYVNEQQIVSVEEPSLVREITSAINHHFKDVSEENRIIILRIDKELELNDAQHAIAGASMSCPSKIKIATLAKNEVD